MNPNLAEDGKKYRFTSTNQPDPKKKRVPKTKTRIKQMVKKHLEKFEEQLEKGNPAFWKMAMDHTVEKPKTKIDQKIKGKLDNKVEVILVDKQDE